MKIEYEGEVLDFDMEEIELDQATKIYKHLGLTLMGLDRGLSDGHPDALRAVWWLIQTQQGKKSDIDSVNFKVVKFANAVSRAADKEAAEKAEGEDPKEGEEAQTET